ncbi:MAG: pantetheine-phosphate adenylyltransferase [Candidatus Omnitrophica bacterium]|nr:pantetheine-phosphate adenylyltransferase [Candidatus Omnitrophota bacterium]
MKVVYPGSFDPLTYGHLDLIKRASKIFDEVVVAVGNNLQKAPLFSLTKRVKLVKEAIKNLGNVSLAQFDGLIIDYVKNKNIKTVIRGLRAISDFEYEFQMALTNRKLDADVETIFMMPDESYSYLSSKLIKEIANLGGDVSQFVPPFVEKELRKATSCKP